MREGEPAWWTPPDHVVVATAARVSAEVAGHRGDDRRRRWPAPCRWRRSASGTASPATTLGRRTGRLPGPCPGREHPHRRPGGGNPDDGPLRGRAGAPARGAEGPLIRARGARRPLVRPLRRDGRSSGASRVQPPWTVAPPLVFTSTLAGFTVSTSVEPASAVPVTAPVTCSSAELPPDSVTAAEPTWSSPELRGGAARRRQLRGCRRRADRLDRGTRGDVDGQRSGFDLDRARWRPRSRRDRVQLRDLDGQRRSAWWRSRRGRVTSTTSWSSWTSVVISLSRFSWAESVTDGIALSRR